MRILCVANYYKPAYVYGGPARSVPALCEAMARAGAEVSVFTTNANGPRRLLDVPTDRSVELDGIEVRYFALGRVRAGFFSPALGSSCRESASRFDAIYLRASWGYPMFAGARAGRRCDVPYVFSPRGNFMTRAMERSSLRKRLYLALGGRAIVDGAAAIHCTSEVEKREMTSWRFKPPLVVIPSGLDVSSFDSLPPRGGLRERLGLVDGAPLSIFVGRLHPIKRLDLIVSAFARVAAELPDARLAIIGPDEGSEANVREQVNALNLGGRVHFPGMLEAGDLMQAYADADLLVLFSAENFGMAGLEAMAAGVPVLLSEDVGIAEEVQAAGAGRIVARDTSSAAREWVRMLTAPDLPSMGARGRALVRDRYTWDAAAARMLDLLAAVTSRAEPRGP